MHPSGQTLEAQVAFLCFHLRRFSLSPTPEPSAPALARDPLHEGKGGRHCALQKGQLRLGDPLAAQGRIQRSQSDSVGGQSFQKGLFSRPHNRSGLEFLLALMSQTLTSPVCLCVCERCLEGGCLLLLPRIQALQTQLSASCVRPSARRSPPKQLGRQLSSYYTSVQGPQGPKEQTERLAEPLWGSAFLQLRGKAGSGTGKAGGSLWRLRRQPRPPRPPRPTARNSRRAPERRRAGAMGQDTALLASRAAGAPSFQVTGASDPRLAELPAWPQEPAAGGRAARLRVHHAGRLGEARSGAFVCNSEQQPSPAPTHPHALCLLTGRSPESYKLLDPHGHVSGNRASDLACPGHLRGARARSLPSRGAALRLRAAAARRPPAAGRTASQSAAARGSMPAGAPPPRGRMAQAGRPAGAHILPPDIGARGPLRRSHGAGGDEAGALWSCHRRRSWPRGSEERGFALRGGRQRSRWRGAPCNDLRGCDRRGRGFRESPLWPTRVASTRRRIRAGGIRPGFCHRSTCRRASFERSLCRRPRPGGWQEAGRGGAGRGRVERGAWGTRGGGAARRRRAGIPGPAARAHRALRRAARAAWPPPSARLPLGACPRLRERVPTPPARPGSRHPPSPPLNLESEPPTRQASSALQPTSLELDWRPGL